MRNNTPREEHQQILFNAELNANFWALIISIAIKNIERKSPKNWEIVLYFITNITNQNDRITMVILRTRLVLLKPIGFL